MIATSSPNESLAKSSNRGERHWDQTSSNPSTYREHTLKFKVWISIQFHTLDRLWPALSCAGFERNKKESAFLINKTDKFQQAPFRHDQNGVVRSLMNLLINILMVFSRIEHFEETFCGVKFALQIWIKKLGASEMEDFFNQLQLKKNFNQETSIGEYWQFEIRIVWYWIPTAN